MRNAVAEYLEHQNDNQGALGLILTKDNDKGP